MSKILKLLPEIGLPFPRMTRGPSPGHLGLIVLFSFFGLSRILFPYHLPAVLYIDALGGLASQASALEVVYNG